MLTEESQHFLQSYLVETVVHGLPSKTKYYDSFSRLLLGWTPLFVQAPAEQSTDNKKVAYSLPEQTGLCLSNPIAEDAALVSFDGKKRLGATEEEFRSFDLSYCKPSQTLFFFLLQEEGRNSLDRSQPRFDP